MMRRAILACLVVALAGVAPRAAAESEGYFPGREWRTSRPGEQGLDGRILSRLVERIRAGEYGRLHSLQIVRNGHLVVDEYFNGWVPEGLHTLQSDTKSITSLLVGIAADHGAVSADDLVLDRFPEYRNIRNVDDRKRSMRVEDLLTMRTGLDWSEGRYEGSPLQQLNESRNDWLKLVLDWPMAEPPGTRFEYNSGGVILLGGIVGNATGRRVDRFARKYLFKPLAIDRVLWARGYPDGLPHTGGGLSMRPRDMAKIGYLVLRGGRWRDRQIVSEAWLHASTSPAVRRPRTFGPYPVDYGYLWWLLPIDGVGADTSPDATIITASGARSQWIFVIPRHDMVVVVTGDDDTYRGFVSPVEFLYEHIRRAVG
jgi:CubicO group peptidase (beta-lactamase class C family)